MMIGSNFSTGMWVDCVICIRATQWPNTIWYNSSFSLQMIKKNFGAKGYGSKLNNLCLCFFTKSGGTSPFLLNLVGSLPIKTTVGPLGEFSNYFPNTKKECLKLIWHMFYKGDGSNWKNLCFYLEESLDLSGFWFFLAYQSHIGPLVEYSNFFPNTKQKLFEEFFGKVLLGEMVGSPITNVPTTKLEKLIQYCDCWFFLPINVIDPLVAHSNFLLNTKLIIFEAYLA